jgi:hypothetical protein
MMIIPLNIRDDSGDRKNVGSAFIDKTKGEAWFEINDPSFAEYISDNAMSLSLVPIMNQE